MKVRESEGMLSDYSISDLHIKLLSLERVSKLNTRNMLAYYKKYRYLRWYYGNDAVGYYSDMGEALSIIVGEYMDSIVCMLNEREHVG